jgi:hypothetical protein
MGNARARRAVPCILVLILRQPERSAVVPGVLNIARAYSPFLHATDPECV